MNRPPAFIRLLPLATSLVLAAASSRAALVINEVDADQPLTDAAEFIEIYDGGVGNTSLNGYFLVWFNGNGDRAYSVIDLSGKTTSPTGYFVVGNAGVPNVGLTFAGNTLQNGNDTAGGSEGDGVALCTGVITDITTGTSGTPVGAIPATVTVVDAVVYDGGNTLSGNDTGLLNGFGMTGQNMVFDSSAAGSSAGRPDNGGGAKNMAAWATLTTASPGASNASLESLSLSFAPATFDESDGPGASTATVTRSGPTAAAVVVTLSSSDASEATVPSTVTIAAGASSATFPVDAVNDGWNDDSQTVTITATAPLFTSTTGNITVNDEGDPEPELIVNEVHATGRGDANGDGVNTTFSEDEFVEIVNVSTAPVDLSNWSLRDGAGLADLAQIRHTFPANSVLNPGCAMVIFGGGNPVQGRTAAFGNAWVIKANGNATNGLSLNDTGDVISLQDPFGTEMAGVSYGAILAVDNTKSLNRNPDLTGPTPLVVHTNVSGAGAALFSPGTKVDGTKFHTLTQSFTVTAASSTVTENAGLQNNFLTISRPAPGTDEVWVTVTTSDASEGTVSVTQVQLAAGVLSTQVSATFPDDSAPDGPQTVVFTAAGEGYLNGTATVTVNDDGNDAPLAAVYINEVDADQAGTDTQEFIELYDGGFGNKPLDGFFLVLYNGSNDQSYLTIDLAGRVTNAQGFYVIGNAAVPNVNHIIPDNTLQNGADAVAIYTGSAATIPVGTLATNAGLVDAVVYGVSVADDTGLLSVLTPGKVQANETSLSISYSLARRPNATTLIQPGQFVPQTPTPGVSNTSITAYDGWAAGYTGLGNADADPDNDGIPNRLEFGLGSNPLNPNAAGQPTPTTVAGRIRATVTKGLNAGVDPAVQFIPEVSTDLVNWTTTGVSILSNDSSAITFEYTGPSTRAQLRTRVVIP